MTDEADTMLAASLEAGFGHLPRKPLVLYNVRRQTLTPPLVRMRRDCDRLLGAAFDPQTLRNSLGFMSLYVGVRMGLVQLSDPRTAHRREVQAECTANYLQLVAAESDRIDDYDRAIAAGIREQQETDATNAAMLARKAELRGQHRQALGRLGGTAA